MPCYYPLTAWRGLKPHEKSGKVGVSFNFREGDSSDPLNLPCGKCDGCRASKSLVWSLRMYHEAQLHSQNSFLTLTYADAPPTLVKSDLQDFFKRLRHQFSFRYFAVGEYGELTRRPHYHAVFFGQDFLEGADDVGSGLYSHKSVLDAWGHGHVGIAPFSMSAACYVAGYVYKKVGDTDTFTLMSRRPGIGREWLRKFGDDLRRTGSVTIEGKEYPIPARYFDWDEDDSLALVKQSRRALVTPRTLDQLRSMESSKKSSLKLRSGKL